MAKRRAGPPSPEAAPQRIILDSGALIQAARGDLRVRAHLDLAFQAGIPVLVPSVVVAETIRGTDRDAPVNRLVKQASEVADLTESIARAAGALLAQARSSSTIDAIVIAHAEVLGGGIVVTADLGDMIPLAGIAKQVRIRGL